MCQKATGNLFGAWVGVRVAELTWTRGEPARFASSEGAMRGFCRDCGTPLLFHAEGSERATVAIGAFDEPQGIALAFELSLEGRLPQVAQLADLPNFGTAEEDDPDGAEKARRTSRQHPDHDTAEWLPR